MMNWKNSITGFILLAIVSFGCRKAVEEEPQSLKAEDYLNISYGTNLQNNLDLYLPEIRDSSTPLIILVHGGSWVGGDKSMFTDMAKYLRDKGFATASINYRLTNTAENNIHPAQVNDIAEAIGFISSKANEWQISSGHIALLGASAGAHLSLLYTYAYNGDNKVKTVIAMAAPSDFTAIGNISSAQSEWVEWLIGSSFQANQAAYVQASPITHISGNSKPTLLFHGKLDEVVPYQQSLDLKTKLGQFNVANKLVLYNDTGHEVLNLNYIPSFLIECENWLKFYLK